MARNPKKSLPPKPASEDVVASKNWWFSPAWNAFFDSKVPVAPWLMLFLGPFYTNDTDHKRREEQIADAMGVVRGLLGRPDIEGEVECAQDYRAISREKTRPQNRLRDLSRLIYCRVDLTDIGQPDNGKQKLRNCLHEEYTPGTSNKYLKTDTYHKNPTPITTLPREAVPYYAELLAWMYKYNSQQPNNLLQSVHDRLQEALQMQEVSPAAPAPNTGLSESTAQLLAVFLRWLARKADHCPEDSKPNLGPLPTESFWTSHQEGEFTAYRILLENALPDSLLFYEGLLALEVQNNRYALRELAAIYRNGRRFSRWNGSWIEVPPNPARAKALEERVQVKFPANAPQRRLSWFYKNWRNLSQGDLTELEALAKSGSSDAALLAQLYGEGTREDVKKLRWIASWRSSPDCCELLKSKDLLNPEETRNGARLGSLYCIEYAFQQGDTQLPDIVCQALRHPGWTAEKLLMLTDCYASRWNGGWNQEQKQAHKAALCMLLPALDEEWSRIRQVLSCLLGKSEEHENLEESLSQQQRQLKTAKNQVSSFLSEILAPEPRFFPPGPQAAMYSASVSRAALQRAILDDGQEPMGEMFQVDEGPL